MKITNANLILKRLKKEPYVSTGEHPESIAFLKNFGLVEVKQRKVLLTPEGNLAAEMGIQEYLRYSETEKEILNFSHEESRKKSKILLLAFFLFFTLFLAAILTNLSFPVLF